MSPTRRKRTAFKRFLADRGANFAVMTALSAPFAIALGAVAVDQGSLFNERRSVQALTDIAAITAAANIDRAEAAVLLTLQDNGVPNAQIDNTGTSQPDAGTTLVSVTPGRYDRSAALGTRFTPGGAPPFDAVRVSMRKIGSLYFGSALMAPPVIGTTATANASAQAAFSIGSGLIDEDTADSPILNPILGGLLGTSLSLRAADYRALAKADVDALAFMDTLATRLGVTAGTYDEVLASKASVGDIVRALANVPGLNGTDKASLEAIAGKVSTTARLSLSQLIDLGPVGRLGIGQGGGNPAVTANALEMVAATAALANGDRQVAVDLGAAIPGLASVSLGIAIGETARSSPWFTVGGKGAVVRTAQIRVRLILKVNGVEGLLGNLVTLPLYVDIAQAKGELAALSCSTGRPESLRVTVDTTPGVADLRIADIDAAAMSNFGQAPAMSPAKIVNVSLLGLGLISVSGQARAAVESSRATALTFSYGDIGNRVVKSASTQNLVGSLTSSLFGSLQLEAHLAGLKITVPASVTAGLGKTLGSVAQPVDGLLNTLLKLLGARVGYADVRVNGATCTQSVLVQ
ncbi:MAG: hypothetical protein WBA36_03580 [Mesorhizobium sp.]